ncbi:MAG: ABC transporter ATP-binding protein [Azospirillum sp.]|nr:ABC transporter ATP-binding protein [Azospirillum sp.]
MEKTPFRYLWHYIRIFKLLVVSVLALNFLSQLCGQVYPLYLAKIYSTAAGEVGTPDYWDKIVGFALAAFVLGLGKVIFFDVTMFIAARILPQVRTLVIRDSFDYVNRHSIAYFTQEMSGNISNKVTQLNTGVLDGFNEFMMSTSMVMYVLIAIGILSFMNVWFFAAMMLWLALIVLVSWKLGQKRSALSRETSRRQSLANGVIVDSLANYSEIKSFANFRFERLNLIKHLRILRRAENVEQKAKAWIHLTQNLFAVVSMLGFMFLSIWIFRRGAIDTTGFIYANSLFAMIAGMVFQLTWVYSNVMRIHGQLKSALDTLAVEPGLKDLPNAADIRAVKAEIEFDGVSFAYAGRENLFENLNLTIKAGEKVGLVGHSGSGKSTFIKLIARYYDTTAGSIKVNGTDIRDVRQDSLHRLISAIPQDVCLFNRSLFDNIRYGRTNATEEEIYLAARQAGADEFIRAFPGGYQTKVGDRGVVLSGGERQRIAIARAILKNAPILVFDEATSALDSQSEKHIQKSLVRLMKNKTVIAIAHRLSTLREMDRILVFDKGRIVEQGTHLSLLRKKGLYYKLYNMQVDGFMMQNGNR